MNLNCYILFDIVILDKKNLLNNLIMRDKKSKVVDIPCIYDDHLDLVIFNSSVKMIGPIGGKETTDCWVQFWLTVEISRIKERLTPLWFMLLLRMRGFSFFLPPSDDFFPWILGHIYICITLKYPVGFRALLDVVTLFYIYTHIHIIVSIHMYTWISQKLTLSIHLSHSLYFYLQLYSS